MQVMDCVDDKKKDYHSYYIIDVVITTLFGSMCTHTALTNKIKASTYTLCEK